MQLRKTCVHCILYAVFFAERGGCSGSPSPPLLGTLLVLSAVIGSIIIYNDLMCSLGRGLQCRYRIIRRNITRHTRRRAAIIVVVVQIIIRRSRLVFRNYWKTCIARLLGSLHGRRSEIPRILVIVHRTSEKSFWLPIVVQFAPLMFLITANRNKYPQVHSSGFQGSRLSPKMYNNLFTIN